MAELRDKYSRMLRQAGQPPVAADATAAADGGGTNTVDAKVKVTAESGDAQRMKVG